MCYTDPEPNGNESVYLGSGVHSDILKGGGNSGDSCEKLLETSPMSDGARVREQEAAAERICDELTTIPIFHPHVPLGRRR